jgi:hypothetical protein
VAGARWLLHAALFESPTAATHTSHCPLVQATRSSIELCKVQVQFVVRLVQLLLGVLRAPAGRQLGSNTRYKLLLAARPVFRVVPQLVKWITALPPSSTSPCLGWVSVTAFSACSVGQCSRALLDLAVSMLLCLTGRPYSLPADYGRPSAHHCQPGGAAPPVQQQQQQQQQDLLAGVLLCPLAIREFEAAVQPYLLSSHSQTATEGEGGRGGGAGWCVCGVCGVGGGGYGATARMDAPAVISAASGGTGAALNFPPTPWPALQALPWMPTFTACTCWPW